MPPSLDASLHLILRKAKGLSRRMGRLLSLAQRFLLKKRLPWGCLVHDV